MSKSMEFRQKYLSELGEYIDKIDNDVTMMLQNLLWDRNSLQDRRERVVCKYDSNHIIFADKRKEHEDKCYFKSQGYTKEDLLLPEPLDPEAHTVVKLTPGKIKEIIENAAKSDPLFKKGDRNESMVSEPLTLDRLQATYTPDERRAIHDAVVSTVPSLHDLSDLALLSENTEGQKPKSRLQVLAELRDMKRRRTRYRVAAPTKNYSHVLKDVIASQMELYTAAQHNIKTEPRDTISDRHEHHYSSRNSGKQTKINEQDKYLRKPYIKREGSSYIEERDGRYVQHDDRKRHNTSNGSERYGYNSSSFNAAQIHIKTEPIDDDYPTEQDQYGCTSTSKSDDYKRRNIFNNKDKDKDDLRHHKKSYSERERKSYSNERDKKSDRYEDRKRHRYERSERDRYSSSSSYDRRHRTDEGHHSKREKYRSYDDKKRRH